jgi:hypothetical protein
LGSKVSDCLVACALRIEKLIASWDSYDNLLCVALIAESDVVVEELSPGPEKHGQVEFVGDDNVVLELGDGLA